MTAVKPRLQRPTTKTQAGIIDGCHAIEIIGESKFKEEEADGIQDAILREVEGGTLGKVGKIPEIALSSEEVAEEEQQVNLDETRA